MIKIIFKFELHKPGGIAFRLQKCCPRSGREYLNHQPCSLFFEGGGQSFVALSVFSFQRVFTKIKIWQKYLLAGGQKFCSPDSQCTDSEECVEAGKDFVCHQVVVIMIIFSIVFIFFFIFSIIIFFISNV